jgi:uncharacterized peroxidase-related enzyme
MLMHSWTKRHQLWTLDDQYSIPPEYDFPWRRADPFDTCAEKPQIYPCFTHLENTMPSHYVLNQLSSVTPASADEAQSQLLDEVSKQTGFIPNMYANMVNAPAVLNTYLHGYKLFRGSSDFSSAEQEVILLAISKVNGCSYCTAAHSMIADKVSGVPAPALDAIRQDKAIPDAKLAALFAFATEMADSRGRPSVDSANAFLSQGYTEKHILHIVLALAVKTLSNYSNHLFDTRLDERFAAYKVN